MKSGSPHIMVLMKDLPSQSPSSLPSSVLGSFRGEERKRVEGWFQCTSNYPPQTVINPEVKQ
jgi:hypothetical protein